MTTRVRWASLCLTLLAGGCSGCLDRAKGTSASTKPQAVEKRPAAPPAAQAHEPSAAGETRIRRAAMAGSWYPAEKEQLATLVDGLLAGARPPKVEGNIMALISPHAGYPFSGKAAATGYELLRGKDVRRVVILALSHHLPFPGASIPDVTHFETPLGLVPVDTTAVARLRRCSVVTTVPEAELREHSLEIQLPLLQRVLPRFSLVPLLVSRMSEKDYPDLAAALGEVVDAHTVVVASSDFTHRGASYSYEVPEGPGTLKERLARLDQGSVDQVLKLSRAGLLAHADQTGTTICGLHPIGVLLELLSRYRGVKGQVVSRYTSGDVTGDWESTVTYVDVVFTGAWPVRSPLDEARSAGEKVFPLSARDKMTLLRLARASLEASVRRGRFDRDAIRSIPPTASLQRRAGAFVTLKCKHGPEAVCIGKGEDLRGCIGTILPQEAVYDTVAQRAASAALEDSRFPHPVAVQELEHVTVEVSVLTPPRPVRGAGEIVVGRHGIILSKEGRSATFLPQVAPEQGWDRETTLRHLAAKAGLPAGSWTEASFQVYEAIVFSEADHLFP